MIAVILSDHFGSEPLPCCQGATLHSALEHQHPGGLVLSINALRFGASSTHLSTFLKAPQAHLHSAGCQARWSVDAQQTVQFCAQLITLIPGAPLQTINFSSKFQTVDEVIFDPSLTPVADPVSGRRLLDASQTAGRALQAVSFRQVAIAH